MVNIYINMNYYVIIFMNLIEWFWVIRLVYYLFIKSYFVPNTYYLLVVYIYIIF